MTSHYKIAQLNSEQQEQVLSLEQQLGGSIMAYETGAKPAALSDEQLDQLQSLEDELGVLLLAFQ